KPGKSATGNDYSSRFHAITEDDNATRAIKILVIAAIVQFFLMAFARKAFQRRSPCSFKYPGRLLVPFFASLSVTAGRAMKTITMHNRPSSAQSQNQRPIGGSCPRHVQQLGSDRQYPTSAKARLPGSWPVAFDRESAEAHHRFQQTRRPWLASHAAWTGF